MTRTEQPVKYEVRLTLRGEEAATLLKRSEMEGRTPRNLVMHVLRQSLRSVATAPATLPGK